MHTPQVRLYLMVGHCALPGKSGALCMPRAPGSFGAGSLPRPEWRWPLSVLSWKPHLNDLTWSRGRVKSLTPVDGFLAPPGSVCPSWEGHSGSEDRLPSPVCVLCGQALLNLGGKITPGFLTSSHELLSSPPPHRESAVCFSSMRFNYFYCWVWL